MTDEAFQTAINHLIQGDKNALHDIYVAYMKLIYAVVLDVVKRKEDAEDVTSEFFIKLMKVAGSYRQGSPHKAWLVMIARNMAIDYLRKANREVVEFANPEGEEGETTGVIERGSLDQTAVANGSNGASGMVGTSSAVEYKTMTSFDMKQAMSTLKPEEKEIVDMKLIGDMKFREISEATGKPIGTITWIYNEAIKKLRRCLVDYERE